MKSLILAAGYATRLYPLTENQPKPLLEVGGKAILQHTLEKISQIPEINEIFIVTNHRFYDHFRIWLNAYDAPLTSVTSLPAYEKNISPQDSKKKTFLQKITLIDDGTLNNNDRLGAVGDIHFTIKEQEINEDILVIAGDNLFGFSLEKFLQFAKKTNASVVALHDLKDIEKVKKKYGVATVEATKIIHFEEKPALPKSALASTACYFFKKEDLLQVEKAIQQGKADNPGDLIKWLVQISEVHGFVFKEHWFDVGSFESLNDAKAEYEQ
ncbi:nucleotidyltransferase family protein [Candidatus Woesearchaeota archaeon]|nr:nucleotidyltransferase family protein [Candidatus Woesearchaeota archaeon]